MSIIQGDLGFPFFAEAVYTYFCTGQVTGVTVPVHQIPENQVQQLVKQVCYICVHIIIDYHSN